MKTRRRELLLGGGRVAAIAGGVYPRRRSPRASKNSRW